jgi:hypothetical protein
MNADRRWADGSTDGSEGDHQGKPCSSQAEPTHWHALLERVRLAVAEINCNVEMVSRTLGGEGLSLRDDSDTLEVTRTAPSLMHLRVTNKGESVSAEWVRETGGDQERGGDGLRRKVSLNFDTDPRSGLILRKESGAGMVLDEAVRHLLTPLLMPLR